MELVASLSIVSSAAASHATTRESFSAKQYQIFFFPEKSNFLIVENFSFFFPFCQ